MKLNNLFDIKFQPFQIPFKRKLKKIHHQIFKINILNHDK